MKRTKLLASIMACVMCISFLAVGVWAAVSVNFGLGASLQFTPEGIFVELSGQVYRGDSEETLEPITSDPRFTLEKQTNFDNSSIEPSGNFPLQSWDIDNLTFTLVARFIEIRVKIKNYSAFAITATPTAQLNNQDITLSSFANFTVTDNRAESGALKSGETKTYSILIELNEGSTEFTGNTLSVSFEFDSLLTWVADDPDTTTANDGYWTLTMGEYQGTPLVWRMILKEENSDVSSVIGYTQDTKLSGSYYFLLETYFEDVFDCAYENEFIAAGDDTRRTDKYENIVNLNDYAVSNIREYLTGVNVYRGYTYGENSDSVPGLAMGQTEPENFITKFHLESSPVYDMIEGRTLTDLYSRMSSTLAGTAINFDSDTSINPDSTIDKFWLLSYYEASKVTVTQSTGNSDEKKWDRAYWLRSPSNVENRTDIDTTLVSPYGGLSIGGVAPNSSYCARPAFKISF